MDHTAEQVKPLKVILVAGLIAGTLDIIAACVQFYINTGKSPAIVLKYIASGVFGGKKAFNSGLIMAGWGLLFHYLIALSFAAFFVFIYRQWRVLSKKILLTGILYGLFVWTIMNLVVVRLSRVSPQPFAWDRAIVAMLILVCMIGIPVALVTKKYYPRH